MEILFTTMEVSIAFFALVGKVCRHFGKRNHDILTKVG